MYGIRKGKGLGKAGRYFVRMDGLREMDVEEREMKERKESVDLAICPSSKLVAGFSACVCEGKSVAFARRVGLCLYIRVGVTATVPVISARQS